MKEQRNPFRMRAAEHIESDANFLRLFGPGMLELLPKDNLWSQVRIFRSAPGGGKTTLFRIFTPSALLALYESQASDDYKELFHRLKDLDVISEQGPQLLGVILSCARNYALLEDLNFEQIQKQRLLYSLLNARLILATLRGACILKKVEYPSGLKQFSIVAPTSAELPVQIPIPGSGEELYRWAYSLEKKVCEAMDSFDTTASETLEGHNTLYSLMLLKPDCILYDGKPIVRRTLILLDDVHQLTTLQRRSLLDTLFELRPSVSIWIAERFEALDPQELINLGATTGREYGEPINLEEFWRQAGTKKFESLVINIANRRVSSVNEVQVGPFDTCLYNTLDSASWHDIFREALEKVRERVCNRAANFARYQEWIKTIGAGDGTVREQAIEWRALEILIERDIRKSQMSFDFALPPEEIDKRESSSLRAIAEYYIAKEFDIPYYFGISRLAILSSFNIEQFLAFSGELFEEIVSAALLHRQTVLPPNRQQVILKKIAQQQWDDIPRRISTGRDVQKFIEAISQFARRENDKPTAPYVAGVTGIAISMSDHDQLTNPIHSSNRSDHQQLVQVLSACLSYNLLEVSLDMKQGKPGKTWMLLYLNRWLCLHFGLPLHYGGWRHKSLSELSLWLVRGFRQSKQETLLS